jgi:signal transduction histidine kinase/DNA-binding response OmpR family regulator
MHHNFPEKSINRKVTTGFFLFLIIAVLAFFISYTGIIRYLHESRKEDPLNKRLMALNELMFHLQESEGKARSYRIKGISKEQKAYLSLQDSLRQSLDNLRKLFADSSYLAYTDTLENLINKKHQQTQNIFELSEINRYRQRYGEIVPLLPDSLSIQINKITWSSIHVADSVETIPSAPDQKGFFGRIASFLSGEKNDQEALPVKTPNIAQVVDSSITTRTIEGPALKEVKQQLQKIEEQDKHFSNLLSRREQGLILLENQLTGTIRTFVKKLEEQAIKESENHQAQLEHLKTDIFLKVIVLGLSGLLIILSFIIRIGNDLKRSRRYKEELIASREKIASLMKVKEKFLANMSHEIRTPLTAIIGFSELMQNESESASIIHNSALHLLSLVNDILDYSTLQEGKLQLQKEQITSGKLIEETYLTLKPKAEQKHLDFTYSATPKDLDFWGDRTRLKQILFNLTGNAIKFTDRGRVHLSFTTRNNQLYFEVSDTGPGIPKEKTQYIFDEFKQFTPQKNPEKGTGLGLAISKKLTEAMGGRISAESEPGKGSIFHFSIPFQKEKQTTEKKNDTPAKTFNEGKILIVDDDPLIEKLVRGFLGEKVQVTGYRSPVEALKHLESERFSLIITDLRMPEINGIQFIKKVRESHSTPILLLSAAVNEHASTEDLKKTDQVFILPKPFSKEDLLKRISRIQDKKEPGENKIKKNNASHSDVPNRQSFDLAGVTSFTGDDMEFLTSITETFISDTKKNLSELSKLISAKKHGEIAEHAHKMQTGFRQFGISKGSVILKGIEILGKKPGNTPELKRGLKRLKKHWNMVEKELSETIFAKD